MAEECPKCEDGLPPWMGTFADLMSLLMCFFVLLLSFATMDAVRFKKMAESMKDAFGVQREIPTNEIVKGISVIKQEFSPATITEPSPIDEIRQQTVEIEKENLKMEEGEKDEKKEEKKEEKPEEKTEEKPDPVKEQLANLQLARMALLKDVAQEARELKELVQDEIDQGLITVETKEANIIVRIQEKGSFPSGQAELNREFLNVIDRISAAIAAMPGKIIVAGHTDNIPISTARFRSNWELSASRAVTVVHEMLRNGDVTEDRVVVEGRADSVPLVDNGSAENRATNRRVEIVIARGEDIFEAEKKLISEPVEPQPAAEKTPIE
jgi:chemotaxis protein MotB